MAQQIINTGEEPNDGTGEPLRSAFNAVNENFSEIYAAGPVGSNVVISGNTISVIGTNNNLVLSGNGIGNVQINSSMMPAVNSVFDIGSPSAQFSTIYAEYFVGNGALLTGISGGGGSGNSISNGDSNIVIAVQDGNVAVSVDGTANVVEFQKRNVAFAANILPSANAFYNIGSANARFQDLYLAGNTIFLGNAQFSANSTTLTLTNPVGGRFVFQGAGDFGPYGDANVVEFLPEYTGNLVSLQGNVRTTANVRASSLIANNVVSTRDLTLTGNIIGTPGVTTLTNVNVNITNATVSSLTVTGTVTGTGSLSITGNIAGGNVNTVGNVTAGNVTTTNVTVSGNIVTGSGSNITGANVISANTFNAGVISATGNITANYFIGNGRLLSGLPESYSNVNVAAYLLTNTGNIAAGAFISNRFVSTDILTLTANTANLRLIDSSGIPVLQPTANTNLIVQTQDSGTHQFEFGSDGEFLVTGSITAPLVFAVDLVINTVRSDDSSAILVDDALNVRGIIQTDTAISAAGNVTADYFIGNGSQLTGVVVSNIGTLSSLTVTGNISSGNINNQNSVNAKDLSLSGNMVATTVGAKIDGFVIGSVTAADADFANANVNGNLTVTGNAAFANVTATGTVSAQGAVLAASAGILGNIAAGNIQAVGVSGTTVTATTVSATGNIVGSFFIGNGSQLTGVVGDYGNSNVTAFLPTYTGNLVSLQGNVNTTANIAANNVSAANLLIASTLATTGDALIGGNLIVNGNTIQVNVEELNVEDPVIGVGRGANNTPLTVNDGKSRGLQLWYYNTQENQAFVGWDTANSVLIAAANVSTTNDVVSVNNYGTFVTGNITASTVSASGNIVTGAGSGGNITGANVISANTVNVASVAASTVTTTGNVTIGNALAVTGNITANTYFGSAAGLTFIPAGNIVGTVALAELANIAATVTANNQPNITAVGALTSLSVTGNVVVDTNTFIIREDLNAVGVGGEPTNKFTVIDSADAVANIQRPAVFYSSNIVPGNRSLVSIGRDATNRAAVGYLYAGNANVNSAVTLGVNGFTVLSINAGNTATFLGDIRTGTVLIDSANASISGLAEINTVVANATGNVTAGGFVTSGNISALGNVQSNNISVTNLIQSNSASITGNAIVGNLTANSNILAVGNVQSNVVVGNLLTSQGNITAVGNVVAANFVGNLVGSFSAPGANTEVLFNTNGVIAADPAFVFDSVANELTVAGNISTNSGGNLNIAGAISVAGNILVSVGNINGGNILGSFMSTTGNVVGGNINTAGVVTATGNITGGNVNTAGSVVAAGVVTATGNITGGNISTSGLITSTGNITGGNISTSGLITSTGNITGGNLVTVGNVISDGLVSAGNIITAGEANIGSATVVTTISAGGNITGGNLLASNLTATRVIFAGTNGLLSDISGFEYTTANSTLTVANIAAAVVDSTGNITGGNLITGGLVSATGNIVGGNLLSATLSLSGNVLSALNMTNDITTTGNISANNIAATTTINIAGNPVATVDDATALAIALG